MVPREIQEAVKTFVIKTLEEPISSNDKLVLIPKLIEAAFK